MAWYEIPGPEQDVVLCTVCGLARDLSGLPFPSRMSAAEAERALSDIGKLLSDNGFSGLDLTTVSRTASASLIELGYASPDHIRVSLPHALYLNEPCGLSAMLCGQDHIRLRCLCTGLALQDAYAGISGVERQLDAKLAFAFDPRYGYLLQDPGEAGTGLTWSVFLFLPGLASAGQIESLSAQLGRRGISLYPASEGVPDGLFRLGSGMMSRFPEREWITAVTSTVFGLIAAERRRRAAWTGAELGRVQDRIYRSYGELRYARQLSDVECRRGLADLRLGASMGLLPEVRVEQLTTLFFRCQSATLSQTIKSTPISDAALETARASHVREQLNQSVSLPAASVLS